MIIGNEGNIPELLLKSNKIQNTKLKLYNVMLTVETLYPTYFKRIMEQNINHQRTPLSKQIEDDLNISGDDKTWFPGWLKTNFSNMDSHLQQMRDAVAQSFADQSGSEDNLGF